MDVTASKPHPIIRGVPDGPERVLPSGMRIAPMRVGNLRVDATQLRQAVAGVASLPLAHQKLVASAGVRVELVPVAALDGAKMLGSTTIIQAGDGLWRPTLVQIAVAAPQSASGTGRESVDNITQHEVGHAVAVLTTQDRGEAVAERYAAAY